jgi:hypothetical protein
MNRFASNTINSSPAPIIPNQQFVIPPITIPQGFSVSQQPIVQMRVKGGAEAAKKIVLPPNSQVAIFDEEDEVFFYRETDVNGNDVGFDTYSYSKIEPPAPPKYLTVDEFRSELEDFGKRLKEELDRGQSVRTQGNKLYNNPGNSSKQQ